MTRDAIVVGAGVVGVATAEALHRRGLAVTLVDRRSGPGEGASFANGAQLSWSYTDALASPSLLKRLPGVLAATDPAFRVRLRPDPDYIRWCLAFLRNCTAARFAANSLAGLQLALRSRLAMAALLERVPLPFDHAVPGKLLLHEDPHAFLAAAEHAARKADAGMDVRAVSVADAVAIEPALEGIAARLVGAIHAPGDAVGDAHLFCAGLTERLGAQGLETRFGIAVSRIEQGATPALVLADGERLAARHIILCTGPDAPALLRPLRWRVPIVPVRGHSITAAQGPAAPHISITDVSRKLVFCRLGDQIRIAGQADVGFATTKVDQARLRTLLADARDSLPDAADFQGPLQPWAGLRPVTPDSLPIVQRRGPVTVNIGHGALGWTYAMATADQAARLVTGEAPARGH
ncbi:FAD-dependent oxidoreductase [Sphingomonas sp. LHG3406-1]|uniref:FAD-dependent oxidoreductase n=1 Tax=Sphingomonas sp. LHG3406-1 TaxID=2804617 RepID=UPI002638A51A|nr:FAD-dependent oxidoreductase [Sphingomonas sp. LHG3406-1]